jgi:DNA-binding PadR family transcriptional regulator
MASRALRSPLSLVVLGLLAEQPLHPYAMRMLMGERGHERTVRAGGASLYDAVARLERAGLIAVESSSREGRRPERTTYRITDAGKLELQALVRAGLGELEGPETFQSAISFMYALPRREVTQLLDQRIAALNALIEHADAGIGEAAQTVPAIFLSEERYAQHLRTAERDWITQFAQQIRSGQLAWPRRRGSQNQRLASLA